MRTTTACLLAVALAACVPQAAAAQTPAKRLSDCQKLAKRYKDRARDPKLVLAVRGNDETGRISACILPKGKVRTIASWDDGLSRDWSSIVATAGTWVLVLDGHGDQYGGTSRALTRVDVRHGRRLSLAGYGCMIDYTQQGCPDGSSYGKVVMAATGAGAYEFTDLATKTTTLRSFSAAGVFTPLATGAVESLRIAGGQIVWIQAGVEHTAPVP